MSNLTKALKTCAKKFNAEAAEIFAETKDAYSFERYGKKAWLKSVKYLLTHFTREQTIWILESKHMRWAADSGEGAYGNMKADTIQKYHENSSLDTDPELPKNPDLIWNKVNQNIARGQKKFKAKMDRLDQLRELEAKLRAEIAQLEKEIDCEYGK